MTKELELKFVEKYPKILRDYGGDKKETCMAWGIECGDGWSDLLDNLMQKIQYVSDKSGVQLIALQIKEKFGTLRFYYTIETENKEDAKIVSNIFDDMIYCAEKSSAHICETTGKGGTLCSRVGWMKTLCKDEADKEGFAPVAPELAKYWDETDNKEISNISNN